eukprot:TRINITY_DN8712_c0_g1_i6.p1 TRINITY_DN8712_c0_g1~~TRINITY_DN8712_c0_g1_i6.p1  ORF type:complete len:325 (+),score=130.36 TRINITY_DN8712_c0_g1_i6:23-997(+)
MESAALSDGVWIEEIESDVLKKFEENQTGFEEGSVRFMPSGQVLPRCYARKEKEISELSVRHDDVWISSFPKCGTTWTQEMVWNIVNNLDFERAKKTDIDEKFFFLDMDCLKSGSHGDAPGFVDKAEQQVGQQRLIKSHLPIGLLPPDLLEKCKVIYVARNPKDVVVSYYHHHKLTKSVDLDLQFSDFVKFFMKELLVEDPYMAHVKEAVALKDNPHVKFLWYEDMKRDLPAAIRDVARFLGKELKEPEIAALADYLDVKNMKKNPAVNHQDRHQRGVFAEGESFIRQGVAGGWKKYFDEELEKTFDEWIENKTKGFKIDFKWK